MFLEGLFQSNNKLNLSLTILNTWITALKEIQYFDIKNEAMKKINEKKNGSTKKRKHPDETTHSDDASEAKRQKLSVTSHTLTDGQNSDVFDFVEPLLNNTTIFSPSKPSVANINGLFASASTPAIIPTIPDEEDPFQALMRDIPIQDIKLLA